MESYRNKGIKEIITEFPKIGEILEEYGIGCGPCTVGICELKDILDIHKMSAEKETELMSRIEAIIYPERDTGTTSPVAASIQNEHVFSAPMQILVDEHTLIKRWLALIPAVIENFEITTDEGLQTFLDGIDLIRSYADRLHHAKEESILFTYFDDTEKIFQVIYEDHRIARSHVHEMLIALDKKDSQSLCQHLHKYGILLAEHIHKEDEILFPWLDEKLSSDQVNELAIRFAQEDKKLAVDTDKYNQFLSKLEALFKK